MVSPAWRNVRGSGSRSEKTGSVPQEYIYETILFGNPDIPEKEIALLQNTSVNIARLNVVFVDELSCPSIFAPMLYWAGWYYTAFATQHGDHGSRPSRTTPLCCL